MTDGLFRETVRGVPSLPEVDGKYDSIQIGEQIVDSAVYRYALDGHYDVLPSRSPASSMRHHFSRQRASFTHLRLRLIITRLFP